MQASQVFTASFSARGLTLGPWSNAGMAPTSLLSTRSSCAPPPLSLVSQAKGCLLASQGRPPTPPPTPYPSPGPHSTSPPQSSPSLGAGSGISGQGSFMLLFASYQLLCHRGSSSTHTPALIQTVANGFHAPPKVAASKTEFRIADLSCSLCSIP